MGFVLSKDARAGGDFTFTRGDDTLTIHHRAISPTLDMQIAVTRAYGLARNIRDGMDGAASLGFQLPEGFGAGWSFDDWQALGATLVQSELLALVATGWEGVTDESGAAFPMTPDAIRTLMLRDEELYRAWCAYAAQAVIEAAEGNVSPPLPNGSSAGAGNTARAAAH